MVVIELSLAYIAAYIQFYLNLVVIISQLLVI